MKIYNLEAKTELAYVALHFTKNEMLGLIGTLADLLRDPAPEEGLINPGDHSHIFYEDYQKEIIVVLEKEE